MAPYSTRRAGASLMAGLGVAIAVGAASAWGGATQSNVVTVPLTYRTPASGPRPNFTPKGTQVTLTDVPASQALPKGAVRPARKGVLQVGPSRDSWIPILATAGARHPSDLTQLYIDTNRNGDFADDASTVATVPTQNEKTRAWWSSFNAIELGVRFPEPDRTEPYLVNVWIVREDGAPAPDLLRYTRASWRSGTVTVNGIEALVAALDGNNDAVYGAGDSWSAIQASMSLAPTVVLSTREARPTSRLMFLEKPGAKDVVLEFRSFKRDGSAVTFAVVDRPVTKAEDRAPDDMLATERPRPRTTTPFPWSHKFDEAIAQAKSSQKRLLIDFETTWCGPCKTMDEWIWTDAEVAAALKSGFVGIKLDGDVEKAYVSRFKVGGYPTMVIVDPSTGQMIKSISGYRSSQQMLAFMK